MADPNPDEVLKMVEAELAMKRARARSGVSSSSRNAFRIWSLVVILGMVLGGLLLLEYMVSQIPHPHHDASAAQQDALPK
jgi:hypothetical protein